MGVVKAQSTIVRKNSAGNDFQRRRVNFIEGSNVTLTVADDSANNEVDVTIAAAGGGSVAGSDTQVQFNDGGAFGGDAGLIFNKTSNVLTVDGGAVINEGGADSDTRIEGDTNVNLLFVDASTDRVGIGTSSPSSLLHVNGVARFSALPLVTYGGPGVLFTDTDSPGLNAGLRSEVGGQLMDFGTNYSQLASVNNSYPACFFRIDTRNTHTDQLFNVTYNPTPASGSSTEVQLMKLSTAGEVDVTGSYKVDGTKVVGNRVVDARCDDAINSGDATTDGVIDALRDAMIAHGLIAAA